VIDDQRRHLIMKEPAEGSTGLFLRVPPEPGVQCKAPVAMVCRVGLGRDDAASPRRSRHGSGQSSTHNAQGSYSNASANGVPVAALMSGVIDPSLDAASSTANTITFTVSLTTCFSGWSSFGSGTQFDFDIAALSAYGDNAARKVYFVMQ
jgi:hypothetical protein